MHGVFGVCVCTFLCLCVRVSLCVRMCQMNTFNVCITKPNRPHMIVFDACRPT